MNEKKERLPWFPCYPSKLLGALAAMKPPEGYVYVVVLLRIYDVGGPCRDSLDALAIRTRMNRRVVSDALDKLFKAGKLLRQGDGIVNPFASDVIESRQSSRRSAIASGQEGARVRWKKTKGNQSNTDSNPKQTPLGFDGYLDLDIDSERKKERKVKSRAKARTALADDWQPSVADLKYAAEHGFDRHRTMTMSQAFSDHHRSRGNVMADWAAAWRTWVGNEVKFSRTNRLAGAPGVKNGNASAALNAINDLYNQGSRDDDKPTDDGHPGGEIIPPEPTGRDQPHPLDARRR